MSANSLMNQKDQSDSNAQLVVEMSSKNKDLEAKIASLKSKLDVVKNLFG